MAAVEFRDDTDGHSSMVDAKLDRYKESNNKPTKSSSSKSKDLSHVPCKFFKVGSCTAGSSCPFSHQVQQPGQQKDVCAWFVKGNCKFGHKCALAHILPGQSPSMDRRNKKAAQMAAVASAGANNSGGTTSKDQHRDKDSKARKSATGAVSTSRSDLASDSAGGRAGTSSRSNSLLSGSTAPTRMLPTGVRPSLPISISKAAPAPAETAPALRDADFASPDTSATLPKAANDDQCNANNMRQMLVQGDASKENRVIENKNAINVMGNVNEIPANGFISSPPRAINVSPFPVSTSSRPHRFADRHDSSASIDFGPVGSPPRAGHPSPSSNNNSTPIRINGFSPGTSPRDPVQNTQPLAAAGPSFGATTSSGDANLFMNPSSPRGGGAVHSGLAASLSLGATTARGAHMQQHTAQPFSVGSLPVLSRPTPDASFVSASSLAYSEVLDEEDMEEFVPSSLKDLLTPEEQNRRMSRASSSRVAGAAGGTGGIPTSVARSAMTIQREDSSRHRHSRSVPSTSLLSRDLRSIWSDNGGELGMDGSPAFGLSPSAVGGLAASTSPSFSPSYQTFEKYDAVTDGPSPSMLSPSNASAAFLGLHQYMGGANSRTPGEAGVRAASQGNIRLHSAGGITSTSSIGMGFGAGTGKNGNLEAGLNHFPSASSSFDPHVLNSRLPVGGGVDGMSSSPSSRHLGGIANTLSSFDVFPSSGSSSSKYVFSQQAAALSTGVGGVGVEPLIRSRPIGAPGHQLDQQALSPASRALQAHVPGQSLPQGLAAGFSKIHLRSTTTTAAFSSGSQISEGIGFGDDGAVDSNNTKTDEEGQEWMSATLMKPNNLDRQQQPQSFFGGTGASRNAISTGWSTGEVEASSTPERPGSGTSRSVGSTVVPTSSNEEPEPQSQSQFQPQSDVDGLTKMLSHLSYSSVAACGLRGSPALPASVSSSSASAPRRSSARTGASGWGVGGSHPLSSPLSGPVLTNDDDDELFSMDEEK